jgi:hypothetical protein
LIINRQYETIFSHALRVSHYLQAIIDVNCFRQIPWSALAAVVGVLAAVASQPGRAQQAPTIVGLHLATYHDNGPYENFNPGFYVVRKNWTAGFYNNSTRQTTVYGGYSWSWQAPRFAGLDSVALTAALATGYPNKIHGTDVSVIVIPSARFKVNDTLGVRLTLLPYVRRYNPATSIHFSIERMF